MLSLTTEAVALPLFLLDLALVLAPSLPHLPQLGVQVINLSPQLPRDLPVCSDYGLEVGDDRIDLLAPHFLPLPIQPAAAAAEGIQGWRLQGWGLLALSAPAPAPTTAPLLRGEGVLLWCLATAVPEGCFRGSSRSEAEAVHAGPERIRSLEGALFALLLLLSPLLVLLLLLLVLFSFLLALLAAQRSVEATHVVPESAGAPEAEGICWCRRLHFRCHALRGGRSWTAEGCAEGVSLRGLRLCRPARGRWLGERR
mmetsp:Transcript_106489/g.237711  ORF Transcript_106489/g.237711 Transcript_106489/m.237711 type:complete len:255 (-) Transcript_106489:1139-1903(-)